MDLIKNKIAIIKLKSYLSRDLKILIPEINYKGKLKFSFIFIKYIKNFLLNLNI